MSKPMGSRAPSATLADVLEAIKFAPRLTDRQRQDWASAVRTVCRVIKREPDEVPLDLRAIAVRLKGVAPRVEGLSTQSWNNVRSLLRKAIALVKPVMPGRARTPMSPAWRTLYEALVTKGDRARLCRLLHWLSVRQVEPETVSLEHLAQFRQELTQDSLLRTPEKTWGQCREAWNRSVERVPGWPNFSIEKHRRKDFYIMPWSAFPASLKADVDAWKARLSGLSLDDEGPLRPLRPATLQTREHQLRAFASALVLTGRDPTSLRSLADLVEPQAFTQGLLFFYHRLGSKPSRQSHHMAENLMAVARHWVKLDKKTLKAMKAKAFKVRGKYDGLTEKNAERLRAFDDPQNVLQLLTLFVQLRREADNRKLKPRRAALLAQIAVAVHLLTVAPIRRQNLVTLDIDRHFVKHAHAWYLVIPRGEVKNSEPLEFELPPRTTELLQWYLDKHRPKLAPAGNRALFPGTALEHKNPIVLAQQVKRIVFERTGLTMNLHLFRHTMVKIYLDQVPGGYEVVRRLLGHKSIETTMKFYAGLETRSASRHFDGVIRNLLDEANKAATQRKPGKGNGSEQPNV